MSLVLLISLLLLLTFVKYDNGQYGGTVMGPFQTLTEPEMEGVPGSWSNKPNAKNTARPIMMKDKNPITYYGHGMPLVPVEPGPIINPMHIVHNTGLAVSPECCPSPYSTDSGCVCGALEDIKKIKI
jgi:hypothetical protein